MSAAAPRVKKFFLLTVPAVLLVLGVVEIWVRATWDPKRGTPALYLADPVLVQRFAPKYSGWFAGVPVHINNLGLHDSRDYTLQKGPRTFRILLLGDSVAFGHGSIEEHTYARLLEKTLLEWRSDVDWQIWNAGVPGYNTSQELAVLRRVGPIYQPDLVIVGFHPNDISANGIVREPGPMAVAATAARNAVKRHFYSYEFYRRLKLQLSWRLFASEGSRVLLENLASEDLLLADTGEVQDLPQQQITRPQPPSPETLAGVRCRFNEDAHHAIERFTRDPEYQRWRQAVDGFHHLQRQGTYRIVFFLSTAPDTCVPDDLFFDAGSRAWNEFFVRELGQGAPAVSAYDAFLPYRPSQMPGARGHALGNANRLKADLLFAFLRDEVLQRAGLAPAQR